MAVLGPVVPVCAQSTTCPARAERAATPADTAYSNGDLSSAESLYAQAVAQHPQDASLAESLVRTLLREGKVAQASAQAATSATASPRSAAALTALAEVELRQGQPWVALQTLDSATTADPCYARAHLVRSRALRIDSMYGSERAEIQRAYDIDPTDPDVLNAWTGIVNAAHEIESVNQSLSTMKDIDADSRQRAEAAAHSMMPLLSENSQTCQGLPSIPSATLPLQPSMPDPKHIDGYKLQVQLPQSEAKLLVDSAASGLYITRALAAANGLQHDPNDPEGTVRLPSMRIGPLEFHNCIVGVSETPFAGKSDGFIGTDIFASYMITLDFRSAKMILDPLPKQPGIVPGDRFPAPALANFTPVYHRRQYLLVPIEFSNRSRKLFILATGMRSSAMSSDAAHSVSRITMNFTNTEQTTSGTRVQFFRDIFDLQLASLPTVHQGHILELDPTVIDRNAGFEIAGMLGLDVLNPLTLHLDYRDGLVKFDTLQTNFAPLLNAKNTAPSLPVTTNESGPEACQRVEDSDIPINSTVEATVTGALDSAHLKPGKEIWLKAKYGWQQTDCRVEAGSILYGHVTAAVSSKDPASSELSLVFDHADCVGHPKQPVQLELVGLIAAADESESIFGALPAAVSGGGRQISEVVAGTTGRSDNLNPGGRPNTVHPGVVIRMPKVKLEPQAGPSCSDRITSATRSVLLGPGAELILLMKNHP
jgi:hypothetical protein